MPATPGRARTFKGLADAIRLRNDTIDIFERADADPDRERRRRMLTFAGGGGPWSARN